MSLMDRLRLAAEEAPKPGTAGRWRPLHFLPSPYSGERINVGVVLIPEGRAPIVELIPHFDRIKCAYGEAIASQAAFLTRVAAEDISNGVPISSPMLRLGRSQFVEWGSLNATLSQLMDYVVPLARPTRAESLTPAVPVKTKKLRKDVAERIKVRAGTDANRVLAQNPSLKFEDAGGVKYLDVPLQGVNRFGTIIAVTARDSSLNQKNASFAAQQVEAAAAARKVEHKGIFMLRPGEGDFPHDVIEEIDKGMDMLVWMFRQQGVHATAELSAEDIATEVMRWGEIRASV